MYFKKVPKLYLVIWHCKRVPKLYLSIWHSKKVLKLYLTLYRAARRSQYCIAVDPDLTVRLRVHDVRVQGGGERVKE